MLQSTICNVAECQIQIHPGNCLHSGSWGRKGCRRFDCALTDRRVTTLGSFHAALKAQEKIGWTAMLRKYWANQWQSEYKRTYQTPDGETCKNKNKRHQQMKRWQKKVIQTTWTALIQLWTLRNKEQHGWDKESRDSAGQEVLHKELADIYDKRDKYPQRVQRLLKQSYDQHIQETVPKLSDWLNTYKGTFAITWAPD